MCLEILKVHEFFFWTQNMLYPGKDFMCTRKECVFCSCRTVDLINLNYINVLDPTFQLYQYPY